MKVAFMAGLAVATAAVAFGGGLIVNGEMEEGKEAPRGWRFGTAWPTKFEASWVRVDDKHGKALCIVSHTAGMSGYWGQTVNLRPHMRYKLRAQVRLVSGRMLIYVHNRQLDARVYYATTVPSPLAPVFVKPEWVRDSRVDSHFVTAGEWFPAELVFDSRDGGFATVSLGSYFLEGEMYFDDLTLEVLPH